MQKRIQALLNLKKYLNVEETEFKAVSQLAELENPWFTQDFIQLAVKNICEAFLDEQKLEAFAKSYEVIKTPKKVGIVMAGNIPLVGFHDLLCGLLSGHLLYIKLSSKDTVLMKYVIEKLKSFDKEIEGSVFIEERLQDCAAFIATGSNQSNVIFKQYFGKYPNLLRRNRTSVAILNGQESEEELKLLADDIYSFFGLGCRNVTKLYVPEGYAFEQLIKTFSHYDYLEMMHKHKNNYDYQLSLLLLNQKMFMSTKSLLLIEKNGLHTPLAVLHYEFYTDINKVKEILKDNEDVQAIVGQDFIPFGIAQQPSIRDFADGVDTMQFLVAL